MRFIELLDEVSQSVELIGREVHGGFQKAENAILCCWIINPELFVVLLVC